MFLETSGAYPVVQGVLEVSPLAAIISIINLLPRRSFCLAYLAVIGLISIATTCDSASYTLAPGTHTLLPVPHESAEVPIQSGFHPDLIAKVKDPWHFRIKFLPPGQPISVRIARAGKIQPVLLHLQG